MFGLRAGFFIGFIGGAIASSLFGKPEQVEAPHAEAGLHAESNGGTGRGALDQIWVKIREAMAAAREVTHEKEREMRREFVQATHRRRS